MKTLKFLTLIALIVMVSVPATISAQDVQPLEPLALSGAPVMLDFNTGAAGPPTVEPLTDGRVTFRIAVAGEVSGDIVGGISGRVSEAYPATQAFHFSTVMFVIETEQGVIEGYYAGSFHLQEGASSADIIASGKILSVSGAYADLYLADVFVTSQVQFVDGRSVGESGTMTIAAR